MIGFPRRRGTTAVRITYDFVLRRRLDPRQIGRVFTLGRESRTSDWTRAGRWSPYPADHIGRRRGAAERFFRGHAGREDRPLQSGARVKGTVQLRVLPPSRR